MVDLQDLWLLETESPDWEEVELAYDHGEVRCWHAAVMLGGELLVHSGLTQEYYLTRQVFPFNIHDFSSILSPGQTLTTTVKG